MAGRRVFVAMLALALGIVARTVLYAVTFDPADAEGIVHFPEPARVTHELRTRDRARLTSSDPVADVGGNSSLSVPPAPAHRPLDDFDRWVASMSDARKQMLQEMHEDAVANGTEAKFRNAAGALPLTPVVPPALRTRWSHALVRDRLPAQ